MNLLDYIIIILMVYLVIMGIFRGFIREIASLMGIILGIIAALVYFPELTNYLRPYLPSTQLLPLISIVIIFAAILIVCNLIGWGLKVLLKKMFLGWLDRGLGAGLAVLKGILIVYIAMVLFTAFLPGKTPLIAESTLAPWVIKSYQSITGLVSPELIKRCKDRVLEEIKRLEKLKTEKKEEDADKDG